MDPQEAATHVATGLKNYYAKYVLPIEKNYQFDKFATPLLNDADFMAKPMVLLMGQYSVGKTTFVRYLLERDFPGARIGPEPTTDKFVAVMNGNNERVVPGNAAAVQKDKPFKALETFGMAFLNRFEVSELSAPILEHITLIDSPGILSGEKQRIQRGYDFPSVVSYWATRADRILLLFDAHKLDISDEFQNAILALKGNFDKIRCVLNKSDQITQQQLMRVYGALLWSLGKVVQTPEVMRVYISSFWDQPYRYTEAKKLFDLEKSDLLNDLKGLPRHSAVRKVNEFVKRTRRAKVHALICDQLRSKFGLFGKEKKQKELLHTMDATFRQVSAKYNVPMGDFPNPGKFANIMKSFEMWKFPALKPQQVTAIDEVLGRGIPGLLSQIEFKSPNPSIGGPSVYEAKQGGMVDQGYNPFAGPKDDMQNMNLGGANWVVDQNTKQQYDSKFYQLSLVNGKASGGQVKSIMLSYQLSNDILARVWELSDLDKDGSMTSEEFALCCYLLDFVKSGKSLPDKLPESYIPPSFRKSNIEKTNYFNPNNPQSNMNYNNQNMQNNNNNNYNQNHQNNNYNQNNNNYNQNHNNNNNNNYNNNQNHQNYSNHNNNSPQPQQHQQHGPPRPPSGPPAPPMMSQQSGHNIQPNYDTQGQQGGQTDTYSNDYGNNNNGGAW